MRWYAESLLRVVDLQYYTTINFVSAFESSLKHAQLNFSYINLLTFQNNFSNIDK